MTAPPMAPAEAPPVLPDAAFAALAAYLRRTTGLEFDAARRPVLTAVITDRLAATGAADAGAYLARVSSPEGAAERDALLDAVVVPETHLFRNPPQMVALRRRILPELLRRAAARGRPLTVWSAGCSTGEEPYSLAVLAAEAAAELDDPPPVRVVGTDLSARSVAAAGAARYRGRSMALVTPQARDRWFEADGDAWRVVPEARALVEVRQHNLVADPCPFGPGEIDLVVCRNVTIYFARSTTSALMQAFHDVLAPGGYLVVGHAETLWQVHDAFTLVPLGDAFAYRREGATTPAAAPPPACAAPSVDVHPAAPALRAPRAVPPQPSSGAPSSGAPSAGTPSAGALLDAAREALAHARYAQAARLAARARAAAPDDPAAALVEGRALMTAGDDDAAVAPLVRAAELDPRDGQAWFLLAGALARTGSPSRAARAYRAAARTLPGTDPAGLDALLDGCDVGALVELCGRLADDADRGALAAPPG